MSYVFSFTFFSLPLIFSLLWWPLAFLILSPPLQIFMFFFQQKNVSFVFLPLVLDLCRPFSRWVLLACRSSVFVFIDSLAASALQDAGGYTISRQNNLQLHLGCHTCRLGYLTLVCLWCGRTVGRTVTWLPNFLGWVDYHIFVHMVLRCVRFARELRFKLVNWILYYFSKFSGSVERK